MTVSRYWVGADPGGKNNFGLAFLDKAGEVLDCTTVSSVDEAVDQITCRDAPLGLGIDTPMWWSSRKGAGRKADNWLRRKYQIPSGTVQTVNSLKGAALVGGMLLAHRIREMFPDTRITESHPKALLLYALKLDGTGFAEQFKIPISWSNEHERDATIGAVCAREGFERRWTFDLARHRYDSEQDPFSYWLAPMNYFWPEREQNVVKFVGKAQDIL